ncbi:MAG TPA: hypothetical protein G4N94_09040 [Caldilineae bacterium]|nr:hypothetical protein [Caldilineae bacterium]
MAEAASTTDGVFVAVVVVTAVGFTVPAGVGVYVAGSFVAPTFGAVVSSAATADLLSPPCAWQPSSMKIISANNQGKNNS